MSDPKIKAIEISPPLNGFECGRCLQLHEGMPDTIPEHSPRCPMREERARAWDDGYEKGRDAGSDNGPSCVNPHR